jgi:hypothetical protein
MKNSTKVKIIKLVKKLLKYKGEDSPPFIIEERKIQRIRTEHIFSDYEKELLKTEEDEIMNHIKRNTVIGMAKTMLAIGAIKFDFEQNNENVKIVATTYVPENLNM